MATVYISLHPLGGESVGSTSATLTTINLTSGSEPIPVLAFDAATDESIRWLVDLRNYGSGNLTLTLRWSAASATSGDVIWTAAVLAYTPDTDSGALSGEAYATANTVTDTHLGTNAQRVMTCDITISNLDSLANNDLVWLKVSRDADNGSDTMTGDAYLVSATLSYSDT